MLYVFFVGSGTMMTLDMNLAMATVASLQVAIEQTFRIPVDNQVLLVSGGATLDPTVQVCTYGAGMDTNPIFLFAKCEMDYQSFFYNDSNSDVDMKERVVACEKMAADYQTLTARSQLARDFADLAIRERRLCNDLVNSQHLQQQGWAAVIANLEDTIAAFKRHVELLQSEAQHYFQSRPLYQDLLHKFPEAVDLLGKVPVLQFLCAQNETETDETEEPVQTLLTRYCTEPRLALEKMAEQCNKWIRQFDEETLVSLNEEFGNILHAADDASMKEIKGIEDRLFRLNRMMENAKKYAEDQRKYSEALNLNLDRVSASNDMSVLSDLCQIHQGQLNEMFRTHMCLRDIRERCYRAKYELSENLQARIKWISWIQNEIFNFNNKVAIYRENLRRLIDHLDVIQQIHLAPTIYVKTLAEIHRRKNFSNRFLKWAKSLSEQSLELYTKEAKARKTFTHSRTDNFVNSLFPGMDDLPPPFATECPEPFDQLLPNISQEDLDKLKNELPELAAMMDVPLPDPMPQTSHKSIVTDSAFSSEVPSSHQTAAPSGSCVSLKDGQLYRTETLSSLGTGEGIAMASPTSSPFEEPFLPNMEVAAKHPKTSPTNIKTEDGGTECKRLHLAEVTADKEMFSPIVEEQNNVESDGDEFERVDAVPKIYDAFVTCSETSDSNEENIRTSKKVSEPISVPSSGNAQTSKCRTVGDLEPSPAEDRLQSPDSNVTSHDFQSADYFIDDSMPSSYTESTGTSALGRGGHHRVKSHHIIVAELQHQLDEKQSALVGTQSSQKMSHTNLLLQRKLSELQRYVHDVKEKMKSDLQLLQQHVTEQRSSVTEEIADIMKNVNTAISDIITQVHLEKDTAITVAVEKTVALCNEIKTELEDKLQQETTKLSDAQSEIERCQQVIDTHIKELEEMKQSYETKFNELKGSHEVEKADMMKNLVLEHELEVVEHEMALKTLREQTMHDLQSKNNEIIELRQIISDKQTHIQMLAIERENIESELKQKLLKDQEQWMSEMETSSKNKYEQMLNQSHEEIEMLKNQVANIEKELRDGFQNDLALKLEEKENELILGFQEEMKQCLEDKDRIVVEKECAIQQLKEISAQQEMTNISNVSSMDRRASQVSWDNPPLPPETDITDTAFSKKELLDMRNKIANIVEKGVQHLSTTDLADLIQRFESILENILNHEQARYATKEVQCTFEHDAVIQTLNKTIHDKTNTIDDLRSRMSFLERKMENANALIKTHFEGDMKRMASSSSEVMPITGARSKLQKFEDATKILQEVRNVIDLPLMSTIESSLMEDNMKKLEMQLKIEKLKVIKLQDQLLLNRTDKVSILTCDRGDIVMFYYDETSNNYMAFNLSNLPHFLHPDSIDALGLEEEESKGKWVITIVQDKEYCQAKKLGNRYKVPIGSRFYRIKATSWCKEEAKQRMAVRSRTFAETQMALIQSASVSVSVPTSEDDVENSTQMSSSAI